MEELAEAHSKNDIKYFLYLFELNLAWAFTFLSFIFRWKNLCPVKNSGEFLPKDSSALVKKITEQEVVKYSR